MASATAIYLSDHCCLTFLDYLNHGQQIAIAVIEALLLQDDYVPMYTFIDSSPASPEVDYDDDGIVILWIMLHLYLHAHRLSLVCTYLYQLVWEGCINIGDDYALCCYMLIEASGLEAVGVHVKGSSHRAAESRLRERELRRQTEINKRIALSGCDTATSRTLTSIQLCRSASKPLIERTRKDASDILLQNLAQSTASQVDESSVADGGNS
ncbi:putative sodium channel modifier 1-like isoform 2 [Capsicum annuum]|nr:putative sodium channel modifier 1-like isoform 2 [Capsicum annuum]KAF3684267.1 putative sodium channel modifier 1-like isoform 2 [Capsicum annuum]